MLENRNVSIVHNITIVNYAVSIFPIATTLFVYIIYYILNHHINYHTYFFPSPSDIIILQPEYRIYSVLMTIETFLILFIFFMQDKVRVILGKKLNKNNNKKFKIMRIISYTGLIIYIIGHELLAIIPYQKSKVAVSIGNNFNGYGLICMFISCDVFNAYLNHASSIISRILTWVIFLTNIFNVLIRYYIFTDDNSINVQWWTMSSVFFIIEQFCGYSKFTLMAKTLPTAAIRLSRKIV